ncbi:MAG: hypothetical protein KDA42_04330 [Planctomycetales bacterium]|nr:hypothetical protein [Planctomycetales bacterium]
MSNRERWIVYPLLFLALSASLRDRLTGYTYSLQKILGTGMQIDLQSGELRGREIRCARLVVDEIRCRAVAVTTGHNEPVVILASGEQDATKHSDGGIFLYNRRGKQVGTLAGHSEGGLLTLEDQSGILSLELGHRPEGHTSGLLAVSQDGKVAPLAPLITRQAAPSPEGASPESPDEPSPAVETEDASSSGKSDAPDTNAAGETTSAGESNDAAPDPAELP